MKPKQIKKGIVVKVITGKEKGKSGKILEVIIKKESVLVEKLNLVKRHTKPTQKKPHGGVVEKEAPIHWSNVAVTGEGR